MPTTTQEEIQEPPHAPQAQTIPQQGAVELQEEAEDADSLTPTIAPPHLRSRAKGCPETAENQMKVAFATLNTFLNRKRKDEDECDLYGRLFAHKLRKLPEHERALFVYEVDGMFLKRMNAPENNSKCSSDQPTL